MEGAAALVVALAGRPAAAYFTLTGGAADATLISVTSPLAIRSELHESMQAGGMASMKPVQQVALPAHGKVMFEPGGKHVMLFDVNPAIKPGSMILLVATFADGRRVQHNARAIAAGDPAPQ